MRIANDLVRALCSVRFQVKVPVPETDVFLFTPGPVMCQLWALDLSWIANVTLPALTDFAGSP